MKVKQIKKIFLIVIVALSFGISNQAYGFFIDYNAHWLANQGLENAREQEKRNRERYEEMYGESESNNFMFLLSSIIFLAAGFYIYEKKRKK